jgi:Flp pilus assembly pilin Flp
VEYAIITGLIVAATITIIANIGGWVEGTFGGLESTLQTEAPVTTGG